MSSHSHGVDSLASFLSLCQTTVRGDEEGTKNALASRARKIVDVLKLNLSGTSHLILDGRHPLVEACRAGNMKIVEMFVNSGANLNFVDPDGRSPLYAAIVGRNCSLQDIRQLLHWGADVNLHRDGKLPLFASLYCMGTEVSRLLISEGADVNNVVLTCFCFIESVFALNTTLVMVMSGFQLQQFEDLPAMVCLALEIVLAGLSPKTFYLSSGKRLPTRSGSSQRYQMQEESLMSAELAMLWRLQHLCLCLGFRVDRSCVECAIEEVKEQLEVEEFTVPSDDKLIAQADESVPGVSNFTRKYHSFAVENQGPEETVLPEKFPLQQVSTVNISMDSNRETETTIQQQAATDDVAEHTSPNTSSSLESARIDILRNKLSQLLWIQRFQASPLPLTYLARMSIRAYLSQPTISKGKHIDNAISILPVPRIFRDFLALSDYRKSMDSLL